MKYSHNCEICKIQRTKLTKLNLANRIFLSLVQLLHAWLPHKRRVQHTKPYLMYYEEDNKNKIFSWFWPYKPLVPTLFRHLKSFTILSYDASNLWSALFGKDNALFCFSEEIVSLKQKLLSLKTFSLRRYCSYKFQDKSCRRTAPGFKLETFILFSCNLFKFDYISRYLKRSILIILLSFGGFQHTYFCIHIFI